MSFPLFYLYIKIFAKRIFVKIIIDYQRLTSII